MRTGNLIHDLADPELSTRFLGDLYQDLSKHAKETYALLQTPVFVEEVRPSTGPTEPALKERPLEGFLMIDPACGSGHFLLGAFTRLLDRWHRHAPGLDAQARVQKALDSINGVDLNPFAIAIARFRLLLAAMQAAGLVPPGESPRFHGRPSRRRLPNSRPRPRRPPRHVRQLRLHALHLPNRRNRPAADVPTGRPLRRSGNPPYITAKDKSLNKTTGLNTLKYVRAVRLTVPFMGYVRPSEIWRTAGWVGQSRQRLYETRIRQRTN